MAPLLEEHYMPLIRRALEEDVGSGDATTLATVPEGRGGAAELRVRQDIVVAGLPVAAAVFAVVDPAMACRLRVADGDVVLAGTVLMNVEGPLRGILTGERTALNFLQHLSGVATLTARYVAAVAGTRARILDTRKTLPGWRVLEKYAVACGGGTNHRQGLFDMIMIKDNHLAALSDVADPVSEGVRRARKQSPGLKVEVEADTLEQAVRAAEAGADRVLLDNMNPDMLREAVQLIAGRCETEASGGVHLDHVRALAESGVDFISVGALTHSAPAVDIGLDFVGADGKGATA